MKKNEILFKMFRKCIDTFTAIFLSAIKMLCFIVVLDIIYCVIGYIKIYYLLYSIAFRSV